MGSSKFLIYAPCFSPVDNKKEAMNHFVAGKRHLLVRDLNAAVDSFAQV